MAWWSSTAWWWFEAWRFASPGWARVYSRGPTELTESEAQGQYLDLRESFWNEVVRAWKWDGSAWRLVYT